MEEKSWHKHWPKGLTYSLDYPEVTADIFLRSAAHKFPERPGIIYGGVEYSYAKLWEGTQKFAAALAGLGIGKGDVVALHMPNCPQFVMAYYGILLAGAVFTPANPMLSPRELEYQLNDCKAKAVVTFNLFLPSVLEVRGRTFLEHIIVTCALELTQQSPLDTSGLGKGLLSFRDLLERQTPHPPHADLNPRTDLAHMAYTGGTTGVSKAVMLTHFNVVANILQTTIWDIGGRPVVWEGILYNEDKYLVEPGTHWEFPSGEAAGITVNVAPWFHALGTIDLQSRMMRAETIVLAPRFDPAAYLDDCEKHQITSLIGAPALFLAMINTPGIEKRQISSVTRLISGAAPVPVELLKRLSILFPNAVLTEGYGMTEVGAVATINPANWTGLRKIGTAGIPLQDTEIKIVDLETGLKEMPCGEEGEICIRGPQCMQGYYNKPEETAAALRDGWMYTGDIGIMDEDGYLSIVDRKKDMLIYKGYNVYPRELEELLFKNPAVASCTVIGVADPLVGEFPKAFVVKKPGVEISEQGLMEQVNEQVIFYKKLRELEFINELPLSPAGKILKRELRVLDAKRRAGQE